MLIFRLLQILNLVVVLLLFLAVIWVIYVTFLKPESNAKKGKQGALPADAGVRDLLAQGKHDEALDLYQRFTGSDLFTAQQAIEDIERELRLSSVEGEVQRLLQAGQKAKAIEVYQANTGAELAEALEVVERLQQKRR